MKYIIEIEDVPFSKVRIDADNGAQNINLYRAKGFNSLVFDRFGLDKLTPLDNKLDEAYQKGLEEGKARNENRCIGCKYDDGRIDRSPCDYCCNAYSNQWSAKPCPDEIEVGDEVTAFCGNAVVVRKYAGKDGVERCEYWYYKNARIDHDVTSNLRKTGRHFPQIAELIEALKEGAE